MYKMQCRDMDVFRNFFIFGAPKFVSPCPPPLNGEIADFHKEPIDHQTEVRWTFKSSSKYIEILSTPFRYSLTKCVSKLNCPPFDRISNSIRPFHWRNWHNLWSPVWVKMMIVVSCRTYWSICYASNIKWKILFGPRDRAVWQENFCPALSLTSTLTMRWFILPILRFHTVMVISLCEKFLNLRNWIVGYTNSSRILDDYTFVSSVL